MVYGERDLKYVSKLHEFVNKFVPRGKLFWVNRLINKLPNTTPASYNAQTHAIN